MIPRQKRKKNSQPSNTPDVYYYIFDTFTGDKKYLTQVHQIENRLMQLGINGHTEKLSMLKSLQEMVEAAIKREAKTIVAVGNDDTISKLMNFLPRHAVTFGMIPLGEPNTITDKLGIPRGVAACDTLSQRITIKLDLGKVNNAFFISSLALPVDQSVTIDFGSYHISTVGAGSTIQIYNMNGSRHSSPTDGMLEAVIREAPSRGGIFTRKHEFTDQSVFPLKKVTIRSAGDSVPVVADGQRMIKTPVTVEVAPQKIKVIVGKNRMF